MIFTEEILIRTAYVLGQDNVKILSSKHIAIFGLGGVGGYAAEALARSGIGELSLIDHDVVSSSNINRQIIALYSTVGKLKVEVLKERLLDINPNLIIHTYPLFFAADTQQKIDFNQFDYVVDAIDSVSSKILLIQKVKELNIPIISSMGTGNKIDPSKLVVTDIYKTAICPLAKVMRYELRKRGIQKLKVIYSTELPIVSKEKEDKRIVGSTAFVPPAAGLLIASEVVKDILNI